MKIIIGFGLLMLGGVVGFELAVGVIVGTLPVFERDGALDMTIPDISVTTEPLRAPYSLQYGDSPQLVGVNL